MNCSINIFSFFSSNGQFGLNTDIYETNILNLAVVVGFLVYYGKVAFTLRFKSRIN